MWLRAVRPIGGIFGVYGQALTEGDPPSALSQSAVSELLDAFRAGDGVDLIRESVRMVMQELIETEAAERVCAARYERTESRVTDRNGVRPRVLATQAGDVELRIPKLRVGCECHADRVLVGSDDRLTHWGASRNLPHPRRHHAAELLGGQESSVGAE